MTGAVGVLKLLADETRLRVLSALRHAEHRIDELAEHIDGGVTPPVGTLNQKRTADSVTDALMAAVSFS